MDVDENKVPAPKYCSTSVQTDISDVSDKRDPNKYDYYWCGKKPTDDGTNGPNVVVIESHNGSEKYLKVSRHTSEEDIVESLDKWGRSKRFKKKFLAASWQYCDPWYRIQQPSPLRTEWLETYSWMKKLPLQIVGLNENTLELAPGSWKVIYYNAFKVTLFIGKNNNFVKLICKTHDLWYNSWRPMMYWAMSNMVDYEIYGGKLNYQQSKAFNMNLIVEVLKEYTWMLNLWISSQFNVTFPQKIWNHILSFNVGRNWPKKSKRDLIFEHYRIFNLNEVIDNRTMEERSYHIRLSEDLSYWGNYVLVTMKFERALVFNAKEEQNMLNEIYHEYNEVIHTDHDSFCCDAAMGHSQGLVGDKSVKVIRK